MAVIQKNEGKIYHDVISSCKINTSKRYERDTIGYGATYKAKSKMKIGTLGFGYADGFNDYFQIIIMLL